MRRKLAAIALAAVPLAGLAAAGTASAAPRPHAAVTQWTAQTSVTGRDDSGGGGDWAVDDFTRTVTVTFQGTDMVTGLGEYSALLSDGGSFTTAEGALTPNQGLDPGVTITSTTTGQMTGTAGYEFEASATPDPALVPAAVIGDSPSTGAWYMLFFPPGTTFAGPGLLNGWSWFYTTLHSLRPHGSLVQTWTDAAASGAGQEPQDGDIRGYGSGGAGIRLGRLIRA